MTGRMKYWTAVLAWGLVISPAVLGGELQVGMGYGEQVGLTDAPQNNAVFDILYDVYAFDQACWRLSFGVGLSWLWDDFDNEEVLIGCIYPSLRYYMGESELFKPYLFVTTGFSYLTEPALGQQLLGGYFAFNDFFGAGAYVGRERLWSVGFCWRHISNAGLFDPNNGIDVPFCILVGRTL